MHRLAVLAVTAVLAGSSGGVARVDVGHGLSVAVPDGWRVSYRHFTPCSDPVERFSVLGAGQILTVQERLDPVREELRARPRHVAVRGRPASLECCALPGRRGWVVQFGDGGRAFYAYLYPGRGTAQALLRTLDSLRVSAPATREAAGRPRARGGSASRRARLRSR